MKKYFFEGKKNCKFDFEIIDKKLQMKNRNVLFLLIVLGLSACTKTKKIYYPNGTLFQEAIFKDALLNGHFKQYYPNGSMKCESDYSDGKLVGITKWYYETGQLQTEMYYIMGKEEGLQKEYNIEGDLTMEAYMKDGKQNGIGKTFFKDGKLKTIQNYINNLNDGGYKQYYHNVRLDMYAIYKKGEVLYCEKYDSLGKFLKKVRIITIEPEKEMKAGEESTLKVTLCGPDAQIVDAGVTIKQADKDTVVYAKLFNHYIGSSIECKFTPKEQGVYTVNVSIYSKDTGIYDGWKQEITVSN
ncbi:MAG: toxin-antitoxin system YwqK family antitoxin [Bacteroidia bacterium]